MEKVEVICPLCKGAGKLEKRNLTAAGLHNGELGELEEALDAGVLGRLLRVGRVAERYLDPKAVSLDAEYSKLNAQLLEAAKTLLREREGDVRESTKEEEKRRTKIFEESRERLAEIEERRKKIEEERLRENRDIRDKVDLIVQALGMPRGKGDAGEILTIKALKAACPMDEFTDAKSDRKGVDILGTVMSGETAAGKIVVSVKYADRWEGAHIQQAKKNLAQEGAQWGILVTRAFPHDALNDGVFLHRSGILVAKPECAAAAYVALREAVLVARTYRDRLKTEVDRLGRQQRLLAVVRDWVTGEGVTRILDALAAAEEKSNDSDSVVEKLVEYTRTAGERVKGLQEELRHGLVEASGLLGTLRDRLQKVVDARRNKATRGSENGRTAGART